MPLHPSLIVEDALLLLSGVSRCRGFGGAVGDVCGGRLPSRRRSLMNLFGHRCGGAGHGGLSGVLSGDRCGLGGGEVLKGGGFGGPEGVGRAPGDQQRGGQDRHGSLAGHTR